MMYMFKVLVFYYEIKGVYKYKTTQFNKRIIKKCSAKQNSCN